MDISLEAAIRNAEKGNMNDRRTEGLAKGKLGDSTVVFPGGIEANLVAGANNLGRDYDCLPFSEVGDIIVRKSGLAFRILGGINPVEGNATGRIIIQGKGRLGYLHAGDEYLIGLEGVCIYRPTGNKVDTNKVSKETSMVKAVVGKAREYVKQHENTIITIALLFAIDHFFFDGQMRGKIRTVLERLFDKLLRTLE